MSVITDQTAATGSGQSENPVAGGDISVRIDPPDPTIVSDLRAVSSSTGAVSYQWSRNGRGLDGASGDRLAKSLYVKGDTIAVTAMSGGRSGTASTVIRNSPPFIVSVSLGPYLGAGQAITATPAAQDVDGDEVQFSYKWSINGNEIEDDSPVLKGGKFKRGDTIFLTIIPSDGQNEGPSFRSEPVIIPNSAPRITSKPPQMPEGDAYTYAVAAQDPDGDELSYSLAAAPPGMTVDSRSGLITWPISSESGGEHSIEVVVQDSEGAKSTQKFTLTIKMKEQKNEL